MTTDTVPKSCAVEVELEAGPRRSWGDGQRSGDDRPQHGDDAVGGDHRRGRA